MSDMTLADIYAPLPESARTYSFDEAKQIVLDGFYAFDTDFGDKAKMMFDEQRIDAPVSAKKRGGAFCSGSTPDVKPYVLLNFLGYPITKRSIGSFLIMDSMLFIIPFVSIVE